MNCWAEHHRLNSQVAQAGVMPLEPVEPCPSRSAGFWLNSYKQLCAKDQLPKSKELQVLSSSDENKVGPAQGWLWKAETQLKHYSQAGDTQNHPEPAVPHHSPCTRALVIQLIKIMLLGPFLSDNDLVLVMVSKLYLYGKFQFPSLDCWFFLWD